MLIFFLIIKGTHGVPDVVQWVENPTVGIPLMAQQK